MSTKVCVAPVKPGWKDAITLGQLEGLIQALYGMGYDLDTPVTYLFDNDHVWLETVRDVDTLERKPRVVQSLGDAERGAIWSDEDGDLWRNRGFRWELSESGEPWRDTSLLPDENWAPYTEVL